MVLDLGPCPVEDAVDWSTFARRILGELRTGRGDGTGPGDTGLGDTAPAEPTTPAEHADLLDQWSALIDDWLERADVCERADQPFRWSTDIDPAQAEFLLAGLDRSLHSAAVRSLCTSEDVERQRPFTVVVVRGFIDGLASESECCRQYADQVSVSLQGLLPD